MLRTKARGSEQGFTLLEVIVAGTLTGLISIPLMMFTYKGLQSYTFLQAQSNASASMSEASQAMSNWIRGATAVITAQNNSLTIYGYEAPDESVPYQIRFFISGTNLEVGMTPPSGTAPNYTYPTPNEVDTTIAQNLALGSTPMFTYYDSSGNQLSSGFTTSQVYAIGIYVASNPSPGQVSTPIAVSTFVTLRNFKTNL